MACKNWQTLNIADHESKRLYLFIKRLLFSIFLSCHLVNLYFSILVQLIKLIYNIISLLLCVESCLSHGQVDKMLNDISKY